MADRKEDPEDIKQGAGARGGIGSSLDPARERIATDTYWNMRRNVGSIRLWLT